MRPTVAPNETAYMVKIKMSERKKWGHHALCRLFREEMCVAHQGMIEHSVFVDARAPSSDVVLLESFHYY